MNYSSPHCILKPVGRLVAVIFLGLVFFMFLTPMELGDFWWHLGTGQWILENGEIPRDDPFSITSLDGRDHSFVLSGFWLCQVLYAAVFGLAALEGIIVLKAAVFTLAFYALLRVLGSYGLGAPLACLLALPALFIATHYDESRPQTFSFAFFALTVLLLELERGAAGAGRSTTRGFFLLPPLMLLWANMHPGFVIGVALVSAYMLNASAVSLLRRDWTGQRRLLLVGALCIAVSALNPNWFEALVRTQQMLLSSIRSTAGIHEHLPLKKFTVLTGEGNLYTAILALIALGSASFAARIRRPDMLHLVVFACLAFISVKTFRGGLFFAIFATVLIGRNLSALELPGALRGRAAHYACALALVAAIVLVGAPRSILQRPLLGEGIFPDKAASFIEASALPGNIYHPYEWGGYLIWRLYPNYKVFIDGRALGSLREHNDVLSARAGWDDILKRRGVNTVLYWPVLPLSGRVPPLLFELLRSDRWSPVYWDTRSVVFVRSALAERPIGKYAVMELLRSLLASSIALNPDVPALHVSLGEVYLRSGLRQEARLEFRKALALEPSNREAAHYLRALGAPNP